MIFVESLIKNKEATQRAGLNKADSVFLKAKGVRAFRSPPFFRSLAWQGTAYYQAYLIK